MIGSGKLKTFYRYKIHLKETGVTTQVAPLIGQSHWLTLSRHIRELKADFSLAFVPKIDMSEWARRVCTPSVVRKQPVIFCCNFSIRKSRSEPLLSKRTEKLVIKRSASVLFLINRASSFPAVSPALLSSGEPRTTSSDLVVSES